MKAYLSALYLWSHGLLAEFIAGAADAFLVVGGGATVAQESLPATAAPFAGRAMVCGLTLAGLRRAAAYLKAYPLPSISKQP